MLALLRAIAWTNTMVLRVGRQLAWGALALMVVVILLQIFFRYVLNDALPWPDEAARFLMLWMTGLMAPSALRWGGFVAIDMVPRSLPRVPCLLLSLALHALSLIVLLEAVPHGYRHSFGFGGNFDSSSLRLPLDLIGMDPVRLKLRYMYLSLFVGVVLMIAVNVELILRTLVRLVDETADLPDDDNPGYALEAE